VWFTDNPWPPIVIVGFVALIFLFLWNANRRGLHMLLALACVGLCFVIYFVERAIVTEREVLTQRVIQLCHDFRDKKPGLLDYISDTKPNLKDLMTQAMDTVTVQSDLRLSDFQTTVNAENTQGKCRFRANATINVIGMGDVGYQSVQVEFVFQREKGVWKIIEIRRFNPINGKEMDPMQRSEG